MTSYLATDALDLDPTELEPEPKPRLHEDDFLGDPALLNAQTAEERAAFWAKVAGAALSQRDAARAEVARVEASATVAYEVLESERDDAESERDAMMHARDALAAQLADLRDGARLAQAAIDAGDKFSGGLLAQGLIARLLGAR